VTPRPCAIALLILVAGAGTAGADENKDLDLIPEGARQPIASSAEASPAGDAGQRIYIENAITLSSQRNGLLVPLPPPPPFHWQNRLFLDVRKEWRPADRVNLTYSGRLNVRAENDLSASSHENLIHDLREAYAGWEPVDGAYIDAGRINLKSGVALGYNPTDFFKTRAVVEPLSADPTVLREDRLGTLMVRGQHIGEGGSLTAAFAPRVSSTSAIYTNTNLPSLDPMFDRTNAQNRLLLKSSVDTAGGFSPEVLLYRQGSQTLLGANLTSSVNQNVVAYLEWAGGRRVSLIDDALRFGRNTGTLPPNAPSALPENSHRSFQNELSVGASYTTETKITFNLEYHFNQAGFSRTDWNNWFATGRDASASSPVARELWFIRSYALDQQQQLSRHVLFLRADWSDAFIPRLELTGFVNTDLYDGSSLVQLSADYHVSNAWTVGAIFSSNFGGKRSDFGSLPQAASFLVKVARYF
jgi:hypothetical protein